MTHDREPSTPAAGKGDKCSSRPGACRCDTWPAMGVQRKMMRGDRDDVSPLTSTRTHVEFTNTPSPANSVDDVDDSGDELRKRSEFDTQRYSSDALPTTSAEFGSLWPSPLRLAVHHDDSTSDGNMNLRVECRVDLVDGRSQVLTLYHLRLRDLRMRRFVLLRHGRDAGKEVCKTARELRQEKPQRPGLPRSLSNIMPKGSRSGNELGTSISHIHRRRGSAQDGHRSATASASDDDHSTRSDERRPSLDELTDTISLEFSNYLQLELRRSGTGSKCRYDFEYWGTAYSWRRQQGRLDGVHGAHQTCYVLRRRPDGRSVARLAPAHLSAEARRREEDAGGWVPPSSIRLADEVPVAQDLGDIVVCTGLLALVDDSIRRNFPQREARSSRSSFSAPARWFDGALGWLSRPSTAH